MLYSSENFPAHSRPTRSSSSAKISILLQKLGIHCGPVIDTELNLISVGEVTSKEQMCCQAPSAQQIWSRYPGASYRSPAFFLGVSGGFTHALLIHLKVSLKISASYNVPLSVFYRIFETHLPVAGVIIAHIVPISPCSLCEDPMCSSPRVLVRETNGISSE